MKHLASSIHFVVLLFLIACSGGNSSDSIIEGISEEVEVIRDQWGINHIYAQNQKDLFFTQGYLAAKDRLFQFEIWRRQATGTVAEILGPRELKRDIGTRLFLFRGDIEEEMNYYHDDGAEIITAFTKGVNAYINEVNEGKHLLPVEFELLGIQPELWTPHVVISRHQGLLGNIGQELDVGRAVGLIGAENVQNLSWFHPKKPDLTIDPAIKSELLHDDILELYDAYRQSVKFLPEDIVDPTAKTIASQGSLIPKQDDWSMIGSNNWVVRGEKTSTGGAVMANDPHRRLATPSLRYMAHLVAPGWNVIGGGEPEIPGISIGHNEHGAWGLTVFRTDGEDLMVYELNPDNINEYRYLGEWESMEVISETINVKDSDPVEVKLSYTRHGPVTRIDTANLVAYAVRCAWLEPGGSPYLASLRMDQAKTWEEFREACNYSHIPGENMVWADKEGNIGWQSVGIAPVRRNFSGMVPVPGDGRYEWDGYLPINEKPNTYNPEEGFFATANQNVTPETYEIWDAIGFSWSDPFRGDRVNEVISEAEKMTMKDMKALQTDYLSIPARTLIPLLLELKLDGEAGQAVSYLRDWDYRLEANSIAAGIYAAWESTMKSNAEEQFLPKEVQPLLSLQLNKLIQWIEDPEQMFGSIDSRKQFMIRSFQEAIAQLKDQLGDDMEQWQYGQLDYKHVYIAHPLSNTLNDSWKRKLDAGPAPRGGNGYTPGSTGNNMNQSSGATFRMIVDCSDWDTAVGSNAPGQSGDPDSKFYNNLFDSWARDEYFPMYFSKSKIEETAAERVVYRPKQKRATP